MLRIVVFTAALVLGPQAIAANQLEMTLGVTPGVYSQTELAELFFADGDETTPRVHFGSPGTVVFSTQEHDDPQAHPRPSDHASVSRD